MHEITGDQIPCTSHSSPFSRVAIPEIWSSTDGMHHVLKGNFTHELLPPDYRSGVNNTSHSSSNNSNSNSSSSNSSTSEAEVVIILHMEMSDFEWWVSLDNGCHDDKLCSDVDALLSTAFGMMEWEIKYVLVIFYVCRKNHMVCILCRLVGERLLCFLEFVSLLYSFCGLYLH